jgi:hypothetical protein
MQNRCQTHPARNNWRLQGVTHGGRFRGLPLGAMSKNTSPARSATESKPPWPATKRALKQVAG